MAERAVIGELGAGCFTPVGVYCREGHLVAEVLSLDGKRTEKVEEQVADLVAARAVGKLLAEKAGDLLAEARAITAGKGSPGGKDAAEG
jgi:hydroxymethylbilane synthase